MRRTHPLILGAGPAGCAAAIVLARAGAEPVLIDRDEVPGDALCGGFLSWRTAARLDKLGVDLVRLGAHPVDRLAVYSKGLSAESALPFRAWGLSRGTLDMALRQLAMTSGARLVIDRVRRVEGLDLIGAQVTWKSDSLFLATGKHDLSGSVRSRRNPDPSLGLRVKLPALPDLSGRIELHLFHGGYAGVVMHECGRANIALAVRKSLLSLAEGSPRMLLERLAADNPAFAKRLGCFTAHTPIQSIGSVPYGWIARSTRPGRFLLGDQAAVIPSLAGEGISIALASGMAAASFWIDDGPAAAPRFQQHFARRASRPVAIASLLRNLTDRPGGAHLATRIASLGNWPSHLLASLTRID